MYVYTEIAKWICTELRTQDVKFELSHQITLYAMCTWLDSEFGFVYAINAEYYALDYDIYIYNFIEYGHYRVLLLKLYFPYLARIDW